ncbi:hypothetical protein [Pseudochrobactrum asaccharolyticum]|uniref:Uncharacterized protein n=1 Tax=Pseudochrobactrum asaccharolyticum TaxID=354351 RepID=A0A366DH12_9HYPH|nr:hypothetical protein [Pseudochrobactrum asaccharolyticum]RBO89301.1 hypothetical protein DFR47_11629 [Pseudochrobactrum asaccharolyticum]
MANPKKTADDANDGKIVDTEAVKAAPQDLVEMNDPSLTGQQAVAKALQAGNNPVSEHTDE